MKSMILATAGHIDHGKTALVRALTGVDADRLPEEKRRGLTIDLGFAYATLPGGTELGFVDVPGHERFLANMLAGVLSIDRVERGRADAVAAETGALLAAAGFPKAAIFPVSSRTGEGISALAGHLQK